MQLTCSFIHYWKRDLPRVWETMWFVEMNRENINYPVSSDIMQTEFTRQRNFNRTLSSDEYKIHWKVKKFLILTPHSAHSPLP